MNQKVYVKLSIQLGGELETRVSALKEAGYSQAKIFMAGLEALEKNWHKKRLNHGTNP
jgi:hypothetical protein